MTLKYPRSLHYKFSPGTTSDDRINHNWFGDLQLIDNVIHTEKMDGENQSLNEFGVFARSHAAPTTNPWSNFLKQKQQILSHDLKQNNLEIFGENMYAIHSIQYPKLTDHFFVFGIRCLDMWLSWEEVEWYSEFFDFKTVPVLEKLSPKGLTEEEFKKTVLNHISEPSIFDSIDTYTNDPCTREGVVTRNILEYSSDDFSHNLFKYVRKGHVKTDTHWSRNWKRAKLIYEQKI